MYNGVKVFDVHGHLTAPVGMRAHIYNLTGGNSPSNPFQSGRRGPDLSDEAIYDAAKGHVDIMDERNIDVQIIGLRPPWHYGWIEKHLVRSWAEFTNDSIAAQVAAFPDRFVGAAMLPQMGDEPDLGYCIEELDRCVNDLGFIGCYLVPDPSGRRQVPGMDQPYWYPVYQRCEELDVPIIVHGSNCFDPRVAPLSANYQLGFNYEQYLCLQLLSRTDVFERFPKLKVVICHCGGGLDRFIKTDAMQLSQKDLSNNLFYDTVAYEIDYLALAIKQRTVPQMLFGTEAPGSGGAIRPETGRSCDDLVPVIGAYDFLSEDDKIDIFNRNVLRVFPKLAEMDENPPPPRAS